MCFYSFLLCSFVHGISLLLHFVFVPVPRVIMVAAVLDCFYFFVDMLVWLMICLLTGSASNEVLDVRTCKMELLGRACKQSWHCFMSDYEKHNCC